MKISVLKIFTTIGAIALFFVACTKTPDSPSYSEMQQATLNAWIGKYVNVGGVQVAEQIEDGLYIEWLSGPSGGTKPGAATDWIELNYLGKSFDVDYRQNIFITRDSIIAKQQKTYSGYTHYVPQYMQYTSTTLMKGVFLAIQEAEMGVGDKMRIYLTSNHSNNLSLFPATNGYGGQYSVPEGLMIFEFEIMNVVSDPQAYANQLVIDLATDSKANGGFGKTRHDTIVEWVYLDIIEYEADAEKRDTIKADSTARLYYTGRFLDGFVFDTNIDSIGLEYERNISSYTHLTYKVSESIDENTSTLIDAFHYIFSSELITYDSKIRFVTNHSKAYGDTGQQSGTAPYTVIQPYCPLIFEVIVLPLKDEEDE